MKIKVNDPTTEETSPAPFYDICLYPDTNEEAILFKRAKVFRFIVPEEKLQGTQINYVRYAIFFEKELVESGIAKLELELNTERNMVCMTKEEGKK